ncbi:hypothetical protein DPMN_176758 [Dreissena polymorpha]|uniref:Uncharacterized protein n=1 Tax=Dreissena polymorpha TaxID=45954 RepID=A0A9D4IJX2_DREPO|nr:hypothetical protein DPMN_176758 [Dreissena polymorpha]
MRLWQAANDDRNWRMVDHEVADAPHQGSPQRPKAAISGDDENSALLYRSLYQLMTGITSHLLDSALDLANQYTGFN